MATVIFLTLVFCFDAKTDGAEDLGHLGAQTQTLRDCVDKERGVFTRHCWWTASCLADR